VPGLARGLRDPDAHVRIEAAERLLSRAPIGTGSPIRRAILTPRETRDALAVLLDVARGDECADVRALAVNALGAFRCDDARAIEVLLTALRDPSDMVRSEAAGALGEVPGDATPVLQGLTAALSDPVAEVRLAAAIALEARTADLEPYCELLLSTLDDPEPLVGEHVAHAIEGLWRHRSEEPGRLAGKLAPVPRTAAAVRLASALGVIDTASLVESIEHEASRIAAIHALAERGSGPLEEGLRRFAGIDADALDAWVLRVEPTPWREGSERVWADALASIACSGPVSLRCTAIAALPAVERSLRTAVLLERLAVEDDLDVRNTADAARAELNEVLGLSR
jgi:HEAT repeat protein